MSYKYTTAEGSLNLLTELKRLNLNTRDVEAFMDTLNKKRFTKGKAKTGEKIKLIAIKDKIVDARNRLDRTLRRLAMKKKEYRDAGNKSRNCRRTLAKIGAEEEVRIHKNHKETQRKLQFRMKKAGVDNIPTEARKYKHLSIFNTNHVHDQDTDQVKPVSDGDPDRDFKLKSHLTSDGDPGEDCFTGREHEATQLKGPYGVTP